MKDITPILQGLGLMDSEIKTYLKALEGGPSTALELTKRSGLSRQAVYTAIESLSDRGIMSSALRGKKKFYAAEHPDKLLAYAKRRETEMKEKISDLERIIPELELRTGGERPIVRVFEGKAGILEIIEDIQGSDYKHSFEISDLDAMYSVLSSEDLAAMRLAVKKRGVQVQGLYAGQPSKPSVEVTRNLLPKEMSGFKSNIGIYGDKVALVTFEGKLYSVIIESAALTKAFHILFKLALKGINKI